MTPRVIQSRDRVLHPLREPWSRVARRRCRCTGPGLYLLRYQWDHRAPTAYRLEDEEVPGDRGEDHDRRQPDERRVGDEDVDAIVAERAEARRRGNRDDEDVDEQQRP